MTNLVLPPIDTNSRIPKCTSPPLLHRPLCGSSSVPKPYVIKNGLLRTATEAYVAFDVPLDGCYDQRELCVEMFRAFPFANVFSKRRRLSDAPGGIRKFDFPRGVICMFTSHRRGDVNLFRECLKRIQDELELELMGPLSASNYGVNVDPDIVSLALPFGIGKDKWVHEYEPVVAEFAKQAPFPVVLYRTSMPSALPECQINPQIVFTPPTPNPPLHFSHCSPSFYASNKNKTKAVLC